MHASRADVIKRDLVSSPEAQKRLTQSRGSKKIIRIRIDKKRRISSARATENYTPEKDRKREREIEEREEKCTESEKDGRNAASGQSATRGARERRA